MMNIMTQGYIHKNQNPKDNKQKNDRKIQYIMSKKFTKKSNLLHTKVYPVTWSPNSFNCSLLTIAGASITAVLPVADIGKAITSLIDSSPDKMAICLSIPKSIPP